MSTYADTSFFVSLYIPDAHSPEAERFWTFDERQKKLAQAVGLKTSQPAGAQT